MQSRLFRIKILFSVVFFLLVSSFSTQPLHQQEVSEQSEIQELIRAGKELYENGEYKEAIIMFLTILTKAKSVNELTEVYFNLSLTYFADAQSEKTEEYLQKMFEIRPDKTIEAHPGRIGIPEP